MYTKSMGMWIGLYIVAVCVMLLCEGAGQNDPAYSPDCDHIHDYTGDIKALGYHTALNLGGSTVWLCERKPAGKGKGSGLYSVGYSTHNRIPLITQTVLEDGDIKLANPGRDHSSFGPSELVPVSEQANDKDYTKSNSRTPRYERFANPGVLQDDNRWILRGNPKISSIHKGHLVADQYIRDDTLKKSTYRYTNAVPQFGVFNSGVWSSCESALMQTWMRTHCTDINSPANRYWRLFIMTGVIPSTGLDARWIGRLGFGDTRDMPSGVTYDNVKVGSPKSGDEYHVNVPAAMWTAACCIQLDNYGNIHQSKNTAFGRDNIPQGSDTCSLRMDISAVLLTKMGVPGNIEPFPNLVECALKTNYKQIKEDPSQRTKTAAQRKRQRPVANNRPARPIKKQRARRTGG